MVFIGVVDAGIAIALAVATGVQSSYIPHPESRCSHLDTDLRFKFVSGFYELAGKLNETEAQGKDICEEFHFEWSFNIAAV